MLRERRAPGKPSSGDSRLRFYYAEYAILSNFAPEQVWPLWCF